ncbi:MAG: hypothetical protein JRN08_03490 [Nitrososphaerota archaeon]|nr:hypothetical protein [Nitrososphaerota archaeon]
MIKVDCSEMTLDDQLALASAISDGLGGRAFAFVKDDRLALDTVSGKVTTGEVAAIVRGFVSKRKDARYYSVELDGDEVRVHTPDPLARSRGRKDTGQLLPENLLKCPFCNFVTPYQELYDVHFRSHGFVG